MPLTEDEQKTVKENYDAILANFASRRNLIEDSEPEEKPQRFLVALFDEYDHYRPLTFPSLQIVEAETADTIRTSQDWWVYGVYDLGSGRQLAWDYEVKVTVQS